METPFTTDVLLIIIIIITGASASFSAFTSSALEESWDGAGDAAAFSSSD